MAKQLGSPSCAPRFHQKSEPKLKAFLPKIQKQSLIAQKLHKKIQQEMGQQGKKARYQRMRKAHKSLSVEFQNIFKNQGEISSTNFENAYSQAMMHMIQQEQVAPAKARHLSTSIQEQVGHGLALAGPYQSHQEDYEAAGRIGWHNFSLADKARSDQLY